MKKLFLNSTRSFIKKNNKNITEEKLDEIMYGLEAIYLTISKMIVIIALSAVLGILKEMFLLLLCYNIIRVTAFGMHAKESYQCLIMSLIMFVGGVYLIKNVFLSIYIKLIIAITTIIIITVFAPADTEKRPLINGKKRKIYKIISITNSIIYTFLITYFNNHFISNYLLLGLVEACIMILPVTYKIFGLKYNNYKNYKVGLN